MAVLKQKEPSDLYKTMYKSEYQMWGYLYENWAKQRDRILGCATTVQMKNPSTIRFDIAAYHSCLKSLYLEWRGMIQQFVKPIDPTEMVKFEIPKEYTITTKEDNKLMISKRDYFDCLFNLYHKKYENWTRFENEKKKEFIPDSIIELLEYIHSYLMEVAQWDMGLGISLQRHYTEDEATSLAIRKVS